MTITKIGTSVHEPGKRFESGRTPLSEELRRLRIAKGVNQTEAANGIGVATQSVISCWETGETAPEIPSFPKISVYYNVPLQRLAKLHLQGQGVSRKNNPLGYDLFYQRILKGETQAAAAHGIGVSKPCFTQWEIGNTTPEIPQYPKISAYCNVPLERLAKLHLQGQGISRKDNPLGYELFYRRILKGEIQAAAAHAIGVSGQDISYWESGKTNPQIPKFPKISVYYNVPLERLAKLHLQGQGISRKGNPLGYELFYRRILRGESQATVSHAIGVSGQTVISHWETGRTIPQIYLLPPLATHYDIPLDQLAALRKAQLALRRAG